MADHSRPTPEASGRRSPATSGEFIHPRLRARHKLPGGWTIRVRLALINPRILTFALLGPDGASRTLKATQDHDTSFIEVIELDDWREYFFDPAIEPRIAKYVLAAFDIQWPLGPLGAQPTGQN